MRPDDHPLISLAKQLSQTEGPGEDQILRANKLAGARVTIQYTDYVGTVVGANMKQGGFYPGSRFPVLVCIDEVQGGDKNVIFEYTFEQVILL